MSGSDRPPPGAVIFGCRGKTLSDAERRLFAAANPLGFILFERNCRSPQQLRGLIADFRAVVGRADAPVLIDQEGGRVCRLKPPHWRKPPPAGRFCELAGRDMELGREAARLNARLIADELAGLGISVDCAPVLDVPAPSGHEIIGDRAYGADADTVAGLGGEVCRGLLEGGVLPVIKHLPGHGRATGDSHKGLPMVDAPRDELAAIDFRPFQALNRMPWGMTAHVLYSALDRDAPATLSRPVIDNVIRGEIGFDGLLLSDDLCMKALSGTFSERTVAALAAGCDVALHCSGDIAEMEQVAAAALPLNEAALDRLARGEAMRGSSRVAASGGMAARYEALMAAPGGG